MGKDKEENLSSQVPVLPIHSAILGMSTQLATEYIFTSMLWMLILAIFPSQCTWNQSLKSLTSLFTQMIPMFTSEFYSGNKIAKPATYM